MRHRIILHRLSFESPKHEMLESGGVDVRTKRSVKDTCALIEESRALPLIVIIDLSLGSSAPEKICRFIRSFEACGGAEAPVILPAFSSRGARPARRAALLGFQQLYAFPEGVFAELLRRFHDVPALNLKRHAERASLGGATVSAENLGFAANLINISASGALFETAQEHDDVDGFTLEIEIDGHAQELSARVIWRARRGDRVRLGVQFVDVGENVTDAIASYVRELNVIRVQGPAVRASLPRDLVKARVRHGKSRVDYFLLDGDLSSGARLLPQKHFFVPYREGDELVLDLLRPRIAAGVRVRIKSQEMLEPDRIDSRIAWHVELAPAVGGQGGE